MDFTQRLIDVRDGDPAALNHLFPLVYEELRRLAHIQLRRGSAGDTLRTTALVHEAYLKLVDGKRVQARDRAHFMALAARVMRQVLIDHFRRNQAQKRGGGKIPVDLTDRDIPVQDRGFVLLVVDDALRRLAELNPRLEQVVEMRFFGGMTEAEVAEFLGITERTVRNDWVKARAWLSRELAED